MSLIYHATATPPKSEACIEAPKGMACIAAGDFVRGSNEGRRNVRPKATVWLQTFYMDTHEVTVADYKACVASGKCTRARTVYSDFSRDQQPKVGASWYQAVEFCKAQGKHLPTEAEWEKAARGTEGWKFPWGNENATCERAVIKDRRGRSCGVRKRGRGPEKGRTFVVGTKAPNQYGLYDMAGNAWEWVYDWYSSGYKRCGESCLGINPRGPCDGAEKCRGYSKRVVRGGSWYWPADYSTTYFRRAHFPSNKPYHHYGFRCAASLAEARKLTQVAP